MGKSAGTFARASRIAHRNSRIAIREHTSRELHGRGPARGLRNAQLASCRSAAQFEFESAICEIQSTQLLTLIMRNPGQTATMHADRRTWIAIAQVSSNDTCTLDIHKLIPPHLLHQQDTLEQLLLTALHSEIARKSPLCAIMPKKPRKGFARKSTTAPKPIPKATPRNRSFNDEFARKADKLSNSIKRRCINYNGPQGLGIGKGGIRRIRKHLLDRERRVVPSRRRIERAAERMAVGKSIPNACFLRLVKDLTNKHTQVPGAPIKWQGKALECLKDMTEGFLVNLFESANLFTLFGNRVTLMPRDLAMLKRVRETNFQFHVTGSRDDNFTPPR